MSSGSTLKIDDSYPPSSKLLHGVRRQGRVVEARLRHPRVPRSVADTSGGSARDDRIEPADGPLAQ